MDLHLQRGLQLQLHMGQRFVLLCERLYFLVYERLDLLLRRDFICLRVVIIY